jgi:hypothetical protein
MVWPSFPVYCDRCGHNLGRSDQLLQLAAIFKPSLMPQIPKADAAEERRQCSRCRFVSIYHPLRTLGEISTV